MCQWPIPPAERTFDLSLLPDVGGLGIIVRWNQGIDITCTRHETLHMPPKAATSDVSTPTFEVRASPFDQVVKKWAPLPTFFCVKPHTHTPTIYDDERTAATHHMAGFESLECRMYTRGQTCTELMVTSRRMG
jgi:hypothetical protein